MSEEVDKNEVILVIDELQVISFDRFTLKLCPSIEHDEIVKVNMNFVNHFTHKKALLEE